MAGIFSVTPIFTNQLILKILDEPKSYIFFLQKCFISSTTSSNNFLSEIDLGYVKLKEVTTPDGTIPIKPFNVT